MGVKTGLHALSGRFGKLKRHEMLRLAGERMGERMLEIVRPLTPVDGGSLQKSWKYDVALSGRGVRVEIENSAEYASYVEEGHRQTPERYVPVIGKTLVEDFVPGQFFLRSAQEKYQRERDPELERRIQESLRQVLEND